MGTLFAPIGEKPLWHSIFEHARELPYGTLITYQELDSLLERDSRTSRAPVYQAVRHLEDETKRTLVCVPNQGYRIAEPAEHLSLVRKRRLRARRQVGKGLRTASATNREMLDDEQARRLDEFELYLGRVDQSLRSTIKRVESVEKVQVTQAQDISNQLAELREAMRQAGISLPGKED